ncbi:hypothetical protein N7481_004519 [Penicillium waksmanii]|uniref:uncharacterized protein n=1 Tax=Penicillium waksmanii TaxID=69791 RepID=UPI002547CB2D|nr:uncharacterized protein N7481_004519 [Penicillium waksmanii]KAJ5989309.1 hypothetical protein N7481_004519 [Penicillium waksmanii]
MKVIFPTIVFLGSSLWGYFHGEIPFTSIRPPSSLAQRTLSSLQLAGSAYALGDLLPANVSSEALGIQSSLHPIHTYRAPGVFDTPTPINHSFIASENRTPKPLSVPLTPNGRRREQENSFERVMLVLMIVNFGILAKLVLYHNEDRANELKSHYDQREYMERLLYLYTGTLPVIGNHMLRQLDQKFAKIEESIQRLHAKFEKFDSGVQDLEDLTNQDRIDEAMARWRKFHERLRELPRETSKAFSDIGRTLEASLETSETDDVSTGED